MTFSSDKENKRLYSRVRAIRLLLNNLQIVGNNEMYCKIDMH